MLGVHQAIFRIFVFCHRLCKETHKRRHQTHPANGGVRIFMKILNIFLLIQFLFACTVIHYEATDIKEFQDLTVPRAIFEYRRLLKDSPAFEGKGLAKVKYDAQGYLNSCEIESDQLPETFKERLCAYVFDRIKFKEDKITTIELPLVFVLNVDK